MIVLLKRCGGVTPTFRLRSDWIRRGRGGGALQQVGAECFAQICLPLFLTHLCADDRCLHRKKTPRVMTKRLGAPSRAPSLVYTFSTPLDVAVLTKCLCPPRHLNR